jgi:chemotaxis protein methyltransferase CheR
MRQLEGHVPEHLVATPIDLSGREFGALRRLVYDRFGIHLTDEKRTMVAVRLQKTLKQRGLPSFAAYYDELQRDTQGMLLTELLNHITTNHTFFYRESSHFDFFVQRALPDVTASLKQHQRNDIRVWSAGCSSGEEPYTLAMLMMEYLGARYSRWDAGVLATDISEKVLNIARAGTYTSEQIAALPATLKHKYFQHLSSQQPSQSENRWKVHPQVQKEVMFRHLNLMNKRFPFKKQMQIIFCRNVMIYFDQVTREALVERFYEVLEPGGYLFIGHAETLGRQQQVFEYILPAVYRKTLL